MSTIMPIYPIGFSINKSKIVNEIPEKKRLLSPLIPGVNSTYIYNNETDYYNNYKESYFAVTCKKGGWDAMRHYEILACGCIPLFIDIDNCPKNTLTFLPKDIINSSNHYYDIIKKYNTFDEIRQEDKEMCNTYISYLLKNTRNFLTNEKMAQYILRTINKNNTKRILFLSGITDADYLRCTTLVGFKELFNTECHDYPKIPHIYTDYSVEDSKKCYGKGMSYTRLIDPSFRNNDYDSTIEDDIENHKYDLIIYGSYHRGMPFWNKVNAHYKIDEIVLLCGEDIHDCVNYWYEEKPCHFRLFLNDNYNIFVREL